MGLLKTELSTEIGGAVEKPRQKLARRAHLGVHPTQTVDDDILMV